eukprot:bmy_02188T0
MAVLAWLCPLCPLHSFPSGHLETWVWCRGHQVLICSSASEEVRERESYSDWMSFSYVKSYAGPFGFEKSFTCEINALKDSSQVALWSFRCEMDHSSICNRPFCEALQSNLRIQEPCKLQFVLCLYIFECRTRVTFAIEQWSAASVTSFSHQTRSDKAAQCMGKRQLVCTLQMRGSLIQNQIPHPELAWTPGPSVYSESTREAWDSTQPVFLATKYANAALSRDKVLAIPPNSCVEPAAKRLLIVKHKQALQSILIVILTSGFVIRLDVLFKDPDTWSIDELSTTLNGSFLAAETLGLSCSTDQKRNRAKSLLPRRKPFISNDPTSETACSHVVLGYPESFTLQMTLNSSSSLHSFYVDGSQVVLLRLKTKNKQTGKRLMKKLIDVGNTFLANKQVSKQAVSTAFLEGVSRCSLPSPTIYELSLNLTSSSYELEKMTATCVYLERLEYYKRPVTENYIGSILIRLGYIQDLCEVP